MVERLPPDMEAAVYHATAGEEVRWAGRSSGEAERAQGWIMIGAGALVALVNLAPAVEFFAAPERPREDGALVEALSALFFFLGGGALAVYGWRFQRAAGRLVWAITNRRLWRIVVGAVQAPRSVRTWTKAQILRVERFHWRGGKEGLSVTVMGSGDNDPTLFIMGPEDIAGAERALALMEG